MKKVLVVDDALFMRGSLRRILEEEGHKVIEAGNGLEAIQKYKESKPDLVTMDITMPKMNGIDALKEIMEINNDAKVLMVSAQGQKSLVIQAIQLGAKGFVVKPFKEEIAREQINRFLC